MNWTIALAFGGKPDKAKLTFEPGGPLLGFRVIVGVVGGVGVGGVGVGVPPVTVNDVVATIYLLGLYPSEALTAYLPDGEGGILNEPVIAPEEPVSPPPWHVSCHQTPTFLFWGKPDTVKLTVEPTGPCVGFRVMVGTVTVNCVVAA
jgi:hypothetical protein